MITLSEYQAKAMETCLPESNNFTYMMNNLVGEVGELASKIAKSKRKGLLWVDDDNLWFSEHIEHQTAVDRVKESIYFELGDVLWQLSGLCSVLGISLEDVAKANLLKLSQRKAISTIDGDGDYR